MNSLDNFLTNYELQGEALKIYTYPAKVLKQKAVEVTEFDENLSHLCKNMVYTMYQAPGIGLAAPQVGQSLRLFVADTTYEKKETTLPDKTIETTLEGLSPKVYINPRIISKSGEISYEEGCLSVPEIYENVTRAQKITVEYQSLTGEILQYEAENLEAVCIQHEIDHLEGIVFLDRLSLFKRNFFLKKLLKKKK